jgi:hypothetical protein
MIVTIKIGEWCFKWAAEEMVPVSFGMRWEEATEGMDDERKERLRETGSTYPSPIEGISGRQGLLLNHAGPKKLFLTRAEIVAAYALRKPIVLGTTWWKLTDDMTWVQEF